MNIPAGDDTNNDAGGDGTGEGGANKGKKRKAHPKFGEYKPGMKLDESWNRAKRHWWAGHAMRDNKNTEAWKAYEKVRLAARMANLDKE